MPSIEKFVHDVLSCKPEDIGEFSQGHIDVTKALSTRPFLTTERMRGRRRRASVEFPQVISISYEDFIIDGHHKFRRATDKGNEYLFSDILVAISPVLLATLYTMSHGYIGDLEIR